MFTLLSLPEYLQKMGSTSFPSPKGGSALAITGAMGAALVKMCCQVSENRNPAEPRYQDFINEADTLETQFLKLADEDTEVVYQMIQAHKLPQDAPEYCQGIQASYAKAAETLSHIGERAQELIELTMALSPLCASSCKIDLDIVENLAKTTKKSAIHGADYNYRVVKEAGCSLQS